MTTSSTKNKNEGPFADYLPIVITFHFGIYSYTCVKVDQINDALIASFNVILQTRIICFVISSWINGVMKVI